jgi:hypothetical protein
MWEQVILLLVSFLHFFLPTKNQFLRIQLCHGKVSVLGIEKKLNEWESVNWLTDWTYHHQAGD